MGNRISKESYTTKCYDGNLLRFILILRNLYYSNEHIFLWELIRNSVDALDKLRETAKFGYVNSIGSEELLIKILLNKTQKTLTIVDTGIGMTMLELLELARRIEGCADNSLEAIAAGIEVERLGSLKLGFHAAFLVANRICVSTKICHHESADYLELTENQYKYPNMDLGSAAKEDVDFSLPHGTQIVLHLRKGFQQFLEKQRIRDMLQPWLQFIEYKLVLVIVETSQTLNELGKQKLIYTEELQKCERPLWRENIAHVREVDYLNFYKALSGDWNDFLAIKRFSCDSRIKFQAMLFTPRYKRHDLYDARFCNSNFRLYVNDRRTTHYDELCPKYLNFLVGIMILEKSKRKVERFSNGKFRYKHDEVTVQNVIAQKAIEMFEGIVTEPAVYKAFYSNFADSLKMGILLDSNNRMRLFDLLRFDTSKNSSSSMLDYVARMQDKQKCIYYLIMPSERYLPHNPYAERLLQLGFEIIYMTAPLDEAILRQMHKYMDKMLCNIMHADLSIPALKSDRDLHERESALFAGLMKVFQKILGKRVIRVVASKRLTRSPCCIVTAKNAWTLNMERLAKAQLFRDMGSLMHLSEQHILEININSSIIKKLFCMINMRMEEQKIISIVQILLDNALVIAGVSLEQPTLHTKRIWSFMSMNMRQLNK